MKEKKIMLESEKVAPLPLSSLNHISVVVRSIESSVEFYENVLGFVSTKRPRSFNFNGAWLYNYGIGIHLLQSEEPERKTEKSEINPKDNHISFQCDSLALVEKKLMEMKIKFVKRIVEEGGIYIDQIFFHDPDGFMIEICNCEDLPVVPLEVGEPKCGCKSTMQCLVEEQQQQQQQQSLNVHVNEDSHVITSGGKICICN